MSSYSFLRETWVALIAWFGDATSGASNAMDVASDMRETSCYFRMFLSMPESILAATTARVSGYAVAELGVRCGGYLVCSSRVRARASDLIAGAASRTTGNIVTHAINQDANQFQKKLPVASDGRLAMPAA